MDKTNTPTANNPTSNPTLTDNPPIDVAVIGAGVAGLSAARDLQAAGREVVVFDKSRGLGGRVATRRYHDRPVDHGAPHLRARDERFAEEIAGWLEHDLLRALPDTHRLDADFKMVAERLEPPAYAFKDGMNTLGKLLADGVHVVRDTTIARLRPAGEGWGLEPASGPTRYARHVVVNLPAEQALALCDSFKLGHNTAIALKNVRFDRCFSVMAGYDAPAPGWYGLRCDDHPTLGDRLGVLYHDSAKRPDPSPTETVKAVETVVVIHSSPQFAVKHYDDNRDDVAATLLGAAAEIAPWLGSPRWFGVQRWRYARVRSAYPERYLAHRPNLHFCGDWCGGTDPDYGVDAAYVSGRAVATALLG
ncbi:MAG: FAD-dependent oxidoreductase, partial [Trueperaceae bacterium]|nr:FAD-dependent oxidoreductase [Trueperaceae bacterium]